MSISEEDVSTSQSTTNQVESRSVEAIEKHILLPKLQKRKQIPSINLGEKEIETLEHIDKDGF